MTLLPPLHPAVARTRLAVRRALAGAGASRGARASGNARASGSAGARASAGRATGTETGTPLILVALSGGADSLALAAAVAFECGADSRATSPRSSRRGVWRAGAVIIDHALQPGSREVARTAAQQAASLGLDPVVIRRVEVDRESGEGIEAAARSARYAALEEVRLETGAEWMLTAHTLDDQAEQVLLGLARGSGTRSVAGIPPVRGRILRPFLSLDIGGEYGVDRQVTEAACAAQRIVPWHDPHNHEVAYTRVRVRERILPELERQLGPGIALALARTAEIARDDADALDAIARDLAETIAVPSEAGIDVPVRELSSHPAAIRHRIIRYIAESAFGSRLTRVHTLRIAALVTDWRGQGTVSVPGLAVTRRGENLQFRVQQGHPARVQ